MTEGRSPKHEVQGFLAIPHYLYSSSTVQFTQWLEGELDFARTIIYQEEIYCRRGCSAGGQRDGSHYFALWLSAPFD
jgi:hypothetical protein